MSLTAKIILVFVLILFVFNAYFRCFVLHPHLVFYYSVLDVCRKIKHRKDITFEKYGIDMFIGMFGKGKTLTMTHQVRKLYQQFGDRLRIVSNYELKGIPYIPLTNFNQLLNFAGVDAEEVDAVVDDLNPMWPENFDDLLESPDPSVDAGFIDPDDLAGAGDEYVGTVVCIDEISSILSNRNYANFPLELLGLLCQPRKKRVYIMCTAQRFFMVDKLFRALTSRVYDCNKIWRLAGYRIYDAWDYEQATSSTILSSIGAGCWFVRDVDYCSYSTDELVTKNKASDFISNDEAIVRKGMDASKVVNTSGVKLSRKAKRRLKTG